ncbi:hypothetical protein WJU16_17945 [Chitinophaga pollutisoli]|uniref:Uncharacterized protein n=1 Tax=Chitinophaga pollutisoli TaxID=3133966 RepID=A0ABZ2YKR2_9BACT
MKNRLILLPAFIALVSISCKKKDKPPSPSRALQYNQTQCIDPWHPKVRSFHPDYAQKLKAWMEAETGETIAKLEVKNVGGDKFVGCDACPPGMRFIYGQPTATHKNLSISDFSNPELFI